MNVQAKILKDMRTQELRRLKKLYKESDEEMTEETIIEKITSDEYEPLGMGCCSLTSSSKFKNQLINFQKACEACENVEKESDGFNIDDFPKLFAFVSFRTELSASKTLDQYESAMECRPCKNIWDDYLAICSCCGKYGFPEGMQYTFKKEEGAPEETKRMKLKKCD